MRYPIQLEGFQFQKLEVLVPGFFSGPRLLVDGEPAPKGPKRGQMLLRRDDGSQIIATWKPRFLDLPQLVVDGQALNIIEPLKWYEWAWSGLPMLLVIFGGMLGVIAGAAGFYLNTRLFRSQINPLLKYALTALISILALILYLVMAIVFVNTIGS